MEEVDKSENYSDCGEGEEHYGGSIHSSTHGSSSNGEQDQTPLIAAKGAKQIARSKLCFLGIMLSAAIGAAFATVKYAREEQHQAFVDKFLADTNEVHAVSRDNAIGTFGVLASLSVTLTSFSKNQATDWPFMTVPDFEHRGSDYLRTSGAQSVAFCPLVPPADKESWKDYSVQHQQWIQSGLNYDGYKNNITAEPIPSKIWRNSPGNGLAVPDVDKWDDALPVWQLYPAPKDSSVINYNLLSNNAYENGIRLSQNTGKVVLSRILKRVEAFGIDLKSHEMFPKNMVIQPIFENFDPQAAVAAFLIVVVPWDLYLKNVLGMGSKPIVCVVKNSCGDVFTYRLDGPAATFLGYEDLHDPKYSHLRISKRFPDFTNAPEIDANFDSDCQHRLEIYPTAELEKDHTNFIPYAYAAAVFMGFMLLTMVFITYDLFVQKRQKEVEQQATRTTAIVNQLFPAEVHDRLYAATDDGLKKPQKSVSFANSNKAHLNTFLNDEAKGPVDKEVDGQVSFPGQVYKTKPIADLFPECTVLFADVTGFTAWSSIRDPAQVFTLLECIYAAFDKIARRNKVFKVETIGDCYVAVCGLPSPREDHAVVMARFAHNCSLAMRKLVHELEVTLGPDTSDLNMRFGLHSGPVTAGVLRGEKARFQLFGDTVNTAARIETTGASNRIHCSEATSILLIAGGKGHWLHKRSEKIFAKGKGEMQTYWIRPKLNSQSSASASTRSYVTGGTTETGEDSEDRRVRISEAKTNKKLSAKNQRLLDWNKERLLEWLQRIVEQRHAAQKVSTGSKKSIKDKIAKPSSIYGSTDLEEGKTVLDEVQEIIRLPKFNTRNHTRQNKGDSKEVEVPKAAVVQLRDYIEVLASLYHENPFHNFEHASHVAQATSKLLSRIVAPEVDADENDYFSKVHDHTYGITSDPLTQFAVIFSALIHDVDHPGVPNNVLVKEGSDLAVLYNDKSVAEQNSVDIAWNLLMDGAFDELRACIYQTEAEMKRFRQLIVNSVMATDIADKELGALRKARWEKAFQQEGSVCDDNINRKATIVIEHLIQASDVSHTMQHWEVYTRWNERLFHEMYLAYKNGRVDANPLDTWYNGEIGFFDFYIIPLVKKLKDCGVFGVSSDEYLNYATENRQQWEKMGQEVVEMYRMKYVKE